MDIPAALRHLRPGSSWYLSGGDYSGLDWRDEKTSKPTIEEIRTFLATYNPALDMAVSKHSLCAALITEAGTNDPDELIDRAIRKAKKSSALIMNDWRHATIFARSSAIFKDDILAAAGLTPKLFDRVWTQAVGLAGVANADNSL